MTASYRQTDLFGGAITASLPSAFADVSNIRQVPDNQEVYLDPHGFTSISVDILERVEQPDADALRFHLADIAEGDGDEAQGLQVWSSGDAVFSKLPKHTPAYVLFATSPPGSKQRGRANEPDLVGVVMCLLRLEEQKTDIVIAINVPHVAGQYVPDEVDPQSGKHGRLLDEAFEYRRQILETFEIKDWSLFVQE